MASTKKRKREDRRAFPILPILIFRKKKELSSFSIFSGGEKSSRVERGEEKN